MEGCSVKKGLQWIKDKVGNTLGSIRNRIFHGIKRTKFDNKFNEHAVA